MKRLACFGVIAVLVFAACGGKTEKAGPVPVAETVGLPANMQAPLSDLSRSLAAKDYASAFASLKSVFVDFWQETPLLLRNPRFVRSSDNSYGIYEPKDNDEFSPGEPLYLYIEPVGYALKRNEQGRYDFGFKADFTLISESGEILGGKEDFARLAFTSWNFNTEIALTFTYTFSGLEKGRYKVVTVVRDAGSDKSAKCENWFSII